VKWHPLVLSLEVTALATVLLFVIGLALAFLLARANFWGRTLLETLINLPMVLPPTVVGYYLLYFLGRGSLLQDWLGVDVLVGVLRVLAGDHAAGAARHPGRPVAGRDPCTG
jgi:molybdate transport system permease protein